MGKFIVVVLLLWSSTAQAYFSVMDTGNVLKEGQYKALAQIQNLFGGSQRNINGTNINARFATGFGQDAELQVEVGVGSLSYYLGAFGKWIPFPNTYEQPALGFRFGFTLANINDSSVYGLNITPLVSQRMESSWGVLTPYVALPLGVQKDSQTSYVSLQLAVGLQWTPDEWDFQSLSRMNFFLEYVSNSSQAFNSVNIGASYSF